MNITEKTPIDRLHPELINRMNDLQHRADETYRKVSYVAKVIRDHEEDDWCEEHTTMM